MLTREKVNKEGTREEFNVKTATVSIMLSASGCQITITIGTGVVRKIGTASIVQHHVRCVKTQ